MSATPEDWARVDAWIDASGDPDDLYYHRIELLGVERFRATGRPVPASLADDERDASVIAMTAPTVLAMVRDALDGDVVLMKGLEVAPLYRTPFTRMNITDLDVLVPDAPAAQRRLLEAGFREVGEPEEYADLHHLRPLIAPGLPVVVEMHHRPKWLRWTEPPPVGALFASAEPSRAGVEGVGRLSPAHHALVLATHSWSNAPLRRLRDMLDIRLVAAEADLGEIERIARAWRMSEVWDATRRAVGALFEPGAPRSMPLRTWARALPAARRPTRPELTAAAVFSPFSGMPLRRIPRGVGGVLVRDARTALVRRRSRRAASS